MTDDLDRDEPEPRLPEVLNPWQGIHEHIFRDTTTELDIEGSRMCAKTTLCLDKEIYKLKKYPGIISLMCRWTDKAVQTKLIPRFEQICKIRQFEGHWNAKRECFEFDNDSRMYAFGLKSANPSSRYEKIRGFDGSSVYVDQPEEVPEDICGELRAALRQKGYPHQITFSPNPVPEHHFLANKRKGGFPIDNSVRGRRYYKLSIFDNAYNLNPADIETMLRTYPVGHAQHKTLILGERGPLVLGDAIYERVFRRAYHVAPIPFMPGRFIEAFDVWKHFPTWLIAQRPYTGGLWLHGGIIGDHLFLSEFLDVVKQKRAEWIAPDATIRSCITSPDTARTDPQRYTIQAIVREHGFTCMSREHSNAPDVVLAMIERIAGYMRQRTMQGHEAFLINDDPSRWLRVSPEDGITENGFIANALEAEYVWDKDPISVESKEVRRPKADDWAEHGMHCVEALELNFGADQPTAAAIAAKRRRQEVPYAGSGHGHSPSGWMGA